MTHDWYCPRCVSVNTKDDRFCWFCRWDSCAPHQEPVKFPEKTAATQDVPPPG